MGNTSADPTRLLDLTRLVSRAGRPLTGVDRVEFAYLRHLLEAGPLYGLVRSSLGYLLLDRRGCALLRDRVAGGGWGEADGLSRVRPGLDPMRARAESDLRRVCLDRCLPVRLSRMLLRHLPRGVRYINTGHSNLTDRVLTALRMCDARVTVFVHDTIPLDYPQYQRPETRNRFRAFLTRVEMNADLVICNSRQTVADLNRHMGRAPSTIVAPLGVEPAPPGRAPDGPWSAPFFVTLGTIEPRKNHALLMQLWPDIPDAHLLVCGGRGWENHAVFAALDAGADRIHELPGLGDAEVAALMQGSAGMLFPSLAEGYGLPPMEAAALGVPVLCNDLPVYREVLDDIPVYADTADGYLWRQSIIQMAEDHRAGRGNREPRFTPPSWETHFKIALTLI